MSLDSVSLERTQPLLLVVDDDADNLVLLIQVVTLFNCAVITAMTGQDTLILAEQYQPDVILLDILLPDISGLEVLRQLRCTKGTATLPVIAVTALARPEDRDRILAAGANDYLTKPYDLEDLETLIRTYLP